MVSQDVQEEVEAYLGTVPSFIEELSEPAADHSWGLMRQLELDETDLSGREKALVGLGAAAAIQCPYCIHFHRAESKVEGVTDEERTEAVNLAGSIRYFSTILHGAEVEIEEFAEETADIMDHVSSQQAAADDD